MNTQNKQTTISARLSMNFPCSAEMRNAKTNKNKTQNR